MAAFNELIGKSGKGLENTREFIYLLDINLGGTLGTQSYSHKTREIEGTFFKGRLSKGGVGNISRNIDPKKNTYTVSDLSVNLSNETGEFSKVPFNNVIQNKKVRLRLGFPSLGLSDYSTLFEGVVKTEKRNNRKYSISAGDFTHKINVKIPPREIKLTEFPNAGTTNKVFGTSFVAEDNIIGKDIPYVYGDYTDANVIRPLFIDNVKNRYLLADHVIGTVIKVFSGGTQVFNFTQPSLLGTSGGGANPYPVNGGTHTGTNLMSFITFGTSQGTNIVLTEIKGKIDSGGTVIENPAIILKDVLKDNKINTGLTETDIGTSTFNISETALSTVKFRHLMNGSITTSIDFIKELSRDSSADFFFNSKNKASFKVFRPSLATNKTVIKREMNKSTFITTKTITDLTNKGVLSYNFSPYTNLFRNISRHEGTVSTLNYQTDSTETLTSKFIYQASDAETFLQRRIRRYDNSITKVNFKTPISKLPIDMADIIDVTHDEGISNVGGWDTRTTQIVGLGINNQTKTINFKVYEADELNQRFFFLGDRNVQGTAFTTASTLDKKYGYLADRTTGLMSDGSPGYRLW